MRRFNNYCIFLLFVLLPCVFCYYDVTFTPVPNCRARKILWPVCGSDGNSYANKDIFNCANKLANGTLTITNPDGACEPKPANSKVKTLMEKKNQNGLIFTTVENCRAVRIFNPVCASNGLSYANEVIFNCANDQANGDLKIVREGHCDDKAIDLRAKMDDVFTTVEKCRAPKIYNPLCASNNRSYVNEVVFDCANEAAGGTLTIVSYEPCTDYVEPVPFETKMASPESVSYTYVDDCKASKMIAPVCASDGKTYINKDYFACANDDAGGKLNIVHEGECTQSKIDDGGLIAVKLQPAETSEENSEPNGAASPTKYDPDVPRKFIVNGSGNLRNSEDNEPQQKFVDNKIKTSKYTLLNFVPKNLFEQFRRIANFYFLCVCIIHFNINSPVLPVTSLLPLIFVVVVTGLKQGYEDWRRHRSDKKVNNSSVQVFKDGNLQDITSSCIAVGDIVKVSSNEEFPCDLLFLTSSNTKSTCEVTTANLDGETNLKVFHCPFGAGDLIGEQDLCNFSALIECQHPQANLYDFKGRLDVFDTRKIYSLNTEHLLLRGARLKNTEFIYGCAVYTGKETKMALNSKMAMNKFSTAERTCNYYLLAFLVVLFLEVLVTTVLKYEVFGVERMENMWYVGNVSVSLEFKYILQDSFSSFILFGYIIPISLYVTLEMQKFMGSFFFQWDKEMRSKETGEYAICNTSDLNEELGQVRYLFSDKTGTLTENLMRFKQCSVAGVKFHYTEDHLKSVDNESIQPLPPNMQEPLQNFLVTLSICHTVKAIVAKADSEKPSDSFRSSVTSQENCVPLTSIELEYQASSPDEKALVEACAALGVKYEGDDQEILRLKVQEKEKRYQRLQILEFDSDRKLMSVIVRDMDDGQIWLVSKGAEVTLLKRCHLRDTKDELIHQVTMKHIDGFAQLGLRTLAVARKKMSESEFEMLSQKLKTAKQEIQNRESAVRSVMDEIEEGLDLLGATGIEDLLQDGVQETLESFAVAKIKVWILTGDKVETAVNIAHLCGLFKRFTNLIYLTNLTSVDEIKVKLKEKENEIRNASANNGLIVDGISLLLLMDEEFCQDFFKVCSQCSAVVCCRLSPKQKAEIVKLVKNCSSKRMVCAAVGDGANDVSMIQEAHIGIGIMGKEGRQAVRCSDFALARFRFLQKALLVHGHWYYTRIATLILYCFYKNIVFITPQVFFTRQSAFSTQSLYEGLVLTLFNLAYASLPIIFFGLFEQVYSEQQLLTKPYLYTKIKNNKNMSRRVFITWSLLGLWHAIVLYYGLWAATQNTPYIPDGKAQDLYAFSIMLAINVIFVCNFKLMIESKYQTVLFLGSIAFSIFSLYATYLIYCAALPQLTVYWSFYVIHKSPLFYFASVIVVFTSLLPDFLLSLFKEK